MRAKVRCGTRTVDDLREAVPKERWVLERWVTGGECITADLTEGERESLRAQGFRVADEPKPDYEIENLMP